MIERAKIQSIIDNLRGFNRIDEAFYKDLDKSFDAQTLNIGVVGKMKAGKSSLINAAIFGDEILPTSVATSTVTLTEISYGEKESATVEFLTKQDVEELKEWARYTGDRQDLTDKAKNANDILKSFPADYEKYIDKPSLSIGVSELKKYVDADGEYSGLAKSVKICYCNDNVKGITIIDTPGFNDPITSRGETTKKVLQKCHVLLFVHDKDGYDAPDWALLTEQIEYAGISEIVDILNKVDLLTDSIDGWPKELDHFIEKRNDIKIENESIRQLLKKSHATYTSTLMALCGLIPYAKLSNDMKNDFGSFEEDFEELCCCTDKSEQQKAFVKYSNIASVVNEINRLAKDGSVYLVNGPLVTLKGKLASIKTGIESEIDEKQARINSLNVTIESSKKYMKDFEDSFTSSVMNKVRDSMIKIELLNLIKEAVKNIQELCSSAASHEFSEEKYPEPTTFSSGVTKANIANFNTFSTGFKRSVRDILYNLKETLINKCKEEINSLIKELSNISCVRKEHMDELKASMINTFVENMEGIDIIVPSHSISELPSGNQKQWDKLRNKFLNCYDDKDLCDFEKGLLACFKQVVDNLGYGKIASDNLNNLRNNIMASLNKTPEEKKRERNGLENEINDLTKELNVVIGHITNIDDIINNVNK